MFFIKIVSFYEKQKRYQYYIDLYSSIKNTNIAVYNFNTNISYIILLQSMLFKKFSQQKIASFSISLILTILNNYSTNDEILLYNYIFSKQ